MKIIKPSTTMKSKPRSNATLETECLYGETIEILDERYRWVYCRSKTDDYCGWIKKDTFGKMDEDTHRVINKRSFIYKEPDAKSDIFFYLPMGSRLAIDKIKSGWGETPFFFKGKIRRGYLPSQHIVSKEHKVKDWVESAYSLVNTPYKWGGRDTIGIDCSALLQLSYQTYGENIPRNTSEQVKIEKRNIEYGRNLKRGFVIFWKGHVGIMIDNINCIHSNAYHMKAAIEPLNDIIKRMGSNNKIIKIMDFN